MLLLITKYAITSFVIVLVSELAKRSGKLGAMLSALPIVTVLVLIWLYLEKQSAQKISEYASYTFWYVIPTLPMFLVMPWLILRGMNFWVALFLSVLVSTLFFVLTAFVARRFGFELIP